jgi:hypothetical protein
VRLKVEGVMVEAVMAEAVRVNLTPMQGETGGRA